LFSKEEVLFAIDFEDGKLPPGFDVQGVVERGPQNRICLGGIDEAGTSHVFLGDGVRGLFTVAGDEVLSFDYWVDPQATQVNFNVWNRTGKVVHEGVVPKLTLGKWAHCSIRLSDLGEGARLREGDWIINVYIHGTGGTARKFYVDNVQFVRPRALRPKASK
jgi:hypothetical protein